MMTHEEIEHRKERIRKDPSTARLCARLGVTVEEFLRDIENKAVNGVLHDIVPPGQEKARMQAVVAIARRVFGQLMSARDAAAQRNSAFATARTLDQENDARRLVGAQE